MEEYEDIEGDAYDAPDATATTREYEQEALSQTGQIACQSGIEEQRNQLVSLGVLKATSGNAAKRLRMRQETRTTARSSKTAEAAIKQIATQERQVETEKMKAWKQIVMQEVAQELQAIRQAHKEAMEIQRRDFVMELERVNERLYQVETTLENEIKASKTQKHALNQRSTQDTPKTPMVPPNTRPTEGSKSTGPIRKSYAQIAASSSTKSATENTWTEVTGGNRKRKSTIPNPPKLGPERRRVIFRREPTSPEKSEADLMLVLNESLQKAGIPAYTRFSRVGYSQSGAIFALLTEKLNAENLVRDHSNMLIRAVKSVDEKVIGIEALERWQRLKVHGMSLARYLGEGKMELLRREIESSIGI